MARRKTINLDDDLIDNVRRATLPAVLISVDPATSTGCCVLRVNERLQVVARTSMQGDYADVGAFLEPLSRGVARFYVREGPATVSMGTAKIGAHSIWSMGYSAGQLDARIDRHLRDDVARWTPSPKTWRSVLGLNQRANIIETEHEATNRAVKEMASRLMKRDVGEDEANAVCLAEAFVSAIIGCRTT